MSLAEGNAVVSAAGAQGLALRSNVVGADEDDAQIIAAQATTVGAASFSYLISCTHTWTILNYITLYIYIYIHNT